MKFHFFKLHGAGNDFIIFDNRPNHLNRNMNEIYSALCDRHFGVGADGVMLFQEAEGFDFEMVYFNADGKESTMCGNGGRCMVRFAEMLGMKQKKFHFLAVDGAHTAETDGQNIRLQMQDVHAVHRYENYYVLNTGSPHAIQFMENIAAIQVKAEGAKVRYGERFHAEGINVNFVEVLSENSIKVRTYERGVEDETLSCGTGVTAAALMYSNEVKLPAGQHLIQVDTLGGKLMVAFKKLSEKEFTHIWLIGPAQFVFSGMIELSV
ncbi:MAG: diaminopimelate epimerase [Chitinophagales bacterium]